MTAVSAFLQQLKNDATPSRLLNEIFSTISAAFSSRWSQNWFGDGDDVGDDVDDVDDGDDRSLKLDPDDGLSLFSCPLESQREE